MPKKSAGILMYRFNDDLLQVFLVHPGGPFWKQKDLGAWSIPKGEYVEGEDPLTVAKREFLEETGHQVQGDMVELSPLKQPSGKVVSAWAVEGELDCSSLVSNSFCIEWPPRSGKQAEFPEIDRGAWFGVEEAREKILKGQVGFIEQLVRAVRERKSE